MIIFQVASALPKTFSEKKIGVLASLLSKRLKIKREEVVGLRFVTPLAIQKLNTTYRKIRRPTDVLSFESTAPWKKDAPEIGDIVICPSYAAKEAKRRGLSLEEELARLVIHGVLHLKGFDHADEKDELKMFSLQEQLVEVVME